MVYYLLRYTLSVKHLIFDYICCRAAKKDCFHYRIFCWLLSLLIAWPIKCQKMLKKKRLLFPTAKGVVFRCFVLSNQQSKAQQYSVCNEIKVRQPEKKDLHDYVIIKLVVSWKFIFCRLSTNHFSTNIMSVIKGFLLFHQLSFPSADRQCQQGQGRHLCRALACLCGMFWGSGILWPGIHGCCISLSLMATWPQLWGC